MVQVRGFLLASPSPLPLGAVVLSTPARFPACSCQLSCSLKRPKAVLLRYFRIHTIFGFRSIVATNAL